MTTAIAGTELAGQLRERFPDAVVQADAHAIWVRPQSIPEVCRFLRDDAGQGFEVLVSVTGVDYVSYFEVVYHLLSIQRNARAVLKTKAYGRGEPAVPSVTSIWQGANLQEREVYDLMGIKFMGHPSLKRIFLWEGFNGHPLRRDYLEPPLPYTWPHGG